MATVANQTPALPQAGSLSSGAALRKVYTAWACIALVLTLLRVIPDLNREFDYRQAWVAADFATMARTFETTGVMELHGVPVNNNPPFGAVPPAYTHWPPLFPLLLGGWFHLFGADERSAHLLMLLLLAATTAALFALARACFSPIGVSITLLAWLGTPAVVSYAHAPIHLNLCVLLMLLANLWFLRAREPGSAVRWQVLSVAALIASILTSWEGVLLPFGWLAHAMLTRNRRERSLALRSLLAGIACAALIVALYLAVYPQQLANLKGVLLVRLRLVDSYPVDPLNNSGSQSPLSLLGVVLFQALRTWDMLGSASLFALLLLFVEAVKTRGRFARDAFAVVALAMGGVWLVWYSVFSHHAAMHDYEALIVAPLAAFAVARLIERGWSSPGKGGAVEKGIAWAIVLPAIVAFPMAAAVYSPPKPAAADIAMVEFGREIGRLTPPGSVVLTPECNMVPIYYSNRRIVRCVETPALLRAALDALPGAFSPQTPVFWAVPRDTTAENRALLNTAGGHQSASLMLVPLGTAAKLTLPDSVP